MSNSVYIKKNGLTEGPFSYSQLYRMLQAGTLSPSDLAWLEGKAWVPLESIADIAASALPKADGLLPQSEPTKNTSDKDELVIEEGANTEDVEEQDVTRRNRRLAHSSSHQPGFRPSPRSV